MEPNRTVYVAEISDGCFDVAFHCPVDTFPWHEHEARSYHKITRSSLARLNHLFYLPRPGVTISAHLVPYINLWVTFPPKGK